MEPGFAHTLGCSLIECSLIARTNEWTVKMHAGRLLDPTADVIGFAARLQERMKLNGSTAEVEWSKRLVN